MKKKEEFVWDCLEDNYKKARQEIIGGVEGRRLTDFEDSIGKTIEKIDYGVDEVYMFLIFTDGTFLPLIPYNPGHEEKLEICICQDISNYELEQVGLITEEQCLKLNTLEINYTKNKRREEEYAQYLHLSKKYNKEELK